MEEKQKNKVEKKQKNKEEEKKKKNKEDEKEKKNEALKSKKEFNQTNKKEKESTKSKRNILSPKGPKKSNMKQRKKSDFSSKKNKIIEVEKPKNNSHDNKTKKVKFSPEKFFSIANKSKETLSTNLETISTDENHKKNKEKLSLAETIKELVQKSKQMNEEKYIEEENNNDIKELKSNEENSDMENEEVEDNADGELSVRRRKDRFGKHFTPIPLLRKKTNGEVLVKSKDVGKAIVTRRQEYNKYIMNLNKPKPKPKPRPKPKPKPKVYDINKVQEIQRIYKGFQIRNVNQIINRLKFNLCVTELNCLILNEIFKHACKRVSFYLLRLYYHDPFTHIENEVDFTDKVSMILSNKYYNFNNLKEGIY